MTGLSIPSGLVGEQQGAWPERLSGGPPRDPTEVVLWAADSFIPPGPSRQLNKQPTPVLGEPGVRNLSEPRFTEGLFSNAGFLDDSRPFKRADVEGITLWAGDAIGVVGHERAKIGAAVDRR